MKLNDKGFTVVEGLLIVIALTLIGGVGYFVYDRQSEKKSDTKTSVVTEQEKAETIQPSAIPQGWVEYKNQELGFSFAHPQTWGVASVSPITFEHTGKGYKVSFSNTDLEGMLASEDYDYTGPGRGGIYWEVSGGSYRKLSSEIIDAAEEAKTGDNYSTQILDQSDKHIVNVYAECVSGGVITDVLVNIGSKQISVLSLAKLRQTSGDECMSKVPPSMIDQSLVNDLKQLAASVKMI